MRHKPRRPSPRWHVVPLFVACVVAWLVGVRFERDA
jgi:hypothetical protein